MRKLLALLTFFSALCNPYSFIHAQETSQNTALLLKTGDINSYRVYRISQQLDAIKGVHFLGYMVMAQTLLITYNEEFVEDPTIIITTVEHLNKGLCVTKLECDNIFTYIDNMENECRDLIPDILPSPLIPNTDSSF